MKRTKSINLDRMRKVSRQLHLAPLGVAFASMTLAGCSDSRKAVVYTNVDQCTAENPELEQECRAAYEDALAKAEKTAPKYRSMRDCESDFGSHTCVNNQTSQSSSIFMPAMAGFMFARALDHNRYDNNPVFTSNAYRSPLYGHWVSSDGYRYGSNRSRKVEVGSDAFKPKPKVTRTMSRGGFGSTVAAKSSWGGSKSRGGWGG
ncbi:DUF1190 family protein [Alkalimarinus alittae]|uniref:DUF1190 family protein n=1 Tax=Alkalimarinus alittae TaxID=2961619 RepID=A0ABY6N5D8_9ALTE|nr:DUF1190 family protein [Alkalimarinus alittae]UZE97347.1 DUF1190 family protein [Alkalimarinus alittae]